MATHEGDQASLHSSIALLQERFRQLQRIREMRQERELLQYVVTTSEPHHHRQQHSTFNTNPKSINKHNNHQYQPSPSLFSNSEMIFQRPSSQLALSLWPESQMMMIKHDNFGELDQTTRGTTTTESSSWLIGTTLGHNNSAVNIFDHHIDPSSDVDTSLHL